MGAQKLHAFGQPALGNSTAVVIIGTRVFNAAFSPDGAAARAWMRYVKIWEWDGQVGSGCTLVGRRGQ